jgi:hypothetical protein
MDAVTDFRSLYPNETFLIIDFTSPYPIKRSINLSNIQFSYESGITTEISGSNDR